MKKLIVAWLLAVVLIVSCNNPAGNNEESSPQIDSRLVGDKWHDRAVSSDMIYFEFTASSVTVAYNGVDSAVTSPAYTNDGKVYGTGTDIVILEYEIVSGTEYDAAIQAAKEANDEVLQYQLDLKDRAAESGNLARFTDAGGTTVEWGRWALVPVP
jgi:hypothetical protein